MAKATDPIGAVLMFGDELIAKLDKIDKGFAEIEARSAQMAKNLNSAFQQTGSLDAFKGSVDNLRNKLEGLEKLKSISKLDQAIRKTVDSQAQAVVEAEKWGQVVNKELDKISDKVKNLKFGKQMFDEKSIASMQWRIERLQTAILSGKKLNSIGTTQGSKEGSMTEELQQEYLTEQEYWKRRIQLAQRSEQQMAEEAIKGAQQTLNIAQSSAEKVYQTDLNLMQQRRQLQEKITALGNNPTGEEAKLLKAYKAELREIDKELKVLAKDYPELAKVAKDSFKIQDLEAKVKAQRKLNEAMMMEPNNAIKMSQEAKSINEKRAALQNLQNVINSLNPKEANYRENLRRLNDEYRRQQTELDRLEGRTRALASAQRGLFDVSGQLRGMLTTVFSVYQVKNFFEDIVKVRGEFELQHKALEVIIQDVDKANELWKQVTQLAVKSPFRVKELVTYTKQLAAFRVETDNLFDVTKRLADISAGLGVDMNRLILAYGQVKAANYLRGQELRQFSEAGINILGELADKFTEVEGRAISVGEVFDRVSKRMVKFQDVAEVFEKLTDEGGTFYKMQEKQAETLKGRISNLKDSFDLMYDAIGKANGGALTSLVENIRKMTDNWRELSTVIVPLFTFIIGKSLALSVLSTNLGKLVYSTKQATIAIRRFGATMRAFAAGEAAATAAVGGWMTALVALTSVIMGVVMAIREHNRVAREMKKISAEGAAEGDSLASSFKRLADEATDATKSYSEQQKALSKLKSMYGEILPSYMLEIDYLKQQAGAYSTAELAIRSYIDAKTRQKQIDFLTEEVTPKLSARREDVKKTLSEYLSHYKVGFSKEDLDKVFMDAEDRFAESGGVFSDALKKSLMDYLRVSKVTAGWVTNGAKESINKFEKTLKRYNEGVKAIEGERTQDYFWANKDQTKVMEETTKRLNKLNSALNDFVRLNDAGNNGSEIAAVMQEIRTFMPSAKDVADSELGKYFDQFKEGGEVLKSTLGDPMLLEEFKKNSEIALKSAALYTDAFTDSLYKESEAQNAVRKGAERLQAQIDAADWDERQKALYEFIQKYRDAHNVSNKVLNDVLLRKDVGTKDYAATVKNLRDFYEGAYKQALGGVILEPFRDVREPLEQIKTDYEFLKDLYPKVALDEKKTTGSGNSLLSQRIELLKKMREEYKKNREQIGEMAASEKVAEENLEAWNTIMGGTTLKLDKFFSSQLGLKKKMEELIPFTSEKEKGKLTKAIGEAGTAVGIEEIEAARAIFKQEMEDLFDAYEFTKEMKKLGIGDTLVRELFDVEPATLKDIQDKLNTWMGEGLLDEEMVKQIQEKINDTEEKSQRDRLKSYVNYLREAMNARVKIEYEAMRKIDDINSMKNVDEGTKSMMILGVNRERDEALSKQVWEDFKGTDGYINLFKDLERQSVAVLMNMRSKIETLRGSLKGLTATEMKDMQEQIQKIDDIIDKKNPFGGIYESMRDAIGLKSRPELEKQRRELENQLAMLTSNRDNAQLQFQLASNKGDEEGAKRWSTAVGSLNKQMEVLDGKIIVISNDISKWDRLEYNIGLAAAATKELTDEIYGLVTAFGGVETEAGKAMQEIIGDTIEAIPQMFALVTAIQEVTAAETAMQAAAGWIGVISMGVSFIIKGITALANYHDAKQQDYINAIQKRVDRLQESFENLQTDMERAFAFDQVITDNQAALDNLEKQIADYRQMISKERAKKNTDEDQVIEWERTVRDIEKQIEEQQIAFIQKVGGIGKDSYASQAEAFADAWLSAFNEGEDAMEALEDTWDETINNMIKKQLTLRVASKYFDELFAYVDNVALNDGRLTAQELDSIQQRAQVAMQGFSEDARSLVDALGFLGTGSTTQLSELVQGIQGMTEQTAEVIASYLNSIRFFVAQNSNTLASVASRILSTDASENPILSELRAQTRLVTNIESLLTSVKYSSAGGSGLKVYVQ